MNVIVSNLNKDKFANLNVDIIKSISGEFSSEEIVQTFSNFFFNRMFLDITSIKNYNDISNIQKLSVGFDVSKIILYIGDEASVNTSSYISKLISLGIYNFARNESELMYLYNNPNQYKDVSHLQTLTEEVVNVQENVEVKDSLVSDATLEKEIISSNTPRVIGFKNFTSHAGSTSLIYMLHKQLSKNYDTVSIEVTKKDFVFFNDSKMISTTNDKLKDVLSSYDKANVILIDLNDMKDSDASSICTDLIFLIEPSTLAINKIATVGLDSFSKLNDFKVVLNDCLLNEKDIKIFANETNVKVFYSLPPMNDREDNSNILLPFLGKLGLYKKN